MTTKDSVIKEKLTRHQGWCHKKTDITAEGDVMREDREERKGFGMEEKWREEYRQSACIWRRKSVK